MKHFGQPLPEGARNKAVHAMIDQPDGMQDHVNGMVVISVPLEGLDPDIVVQLWVHDWE